MRFPFRILTLLFFTAATPPARAADDSPALATSVVNTRADGALEGQTDLGLPLLSLPLDSRSSFANYVGRFVPGASLYQGSVLLRGGSPIDTATFLDGFWVRRLEVPLSMLARGDVAGAGYGAGWSDIGGGVIDLETKTGANRPGVDLDLYKEALAAQDGLAFSPTVTGPIVRDRLFFAVSGRIERSWGEPMRDPKEIFATAPAPRAGAELGALKLTWVPAEKQRFDVLVVLGQGRASNGADFHVQTEAQPVLDSSDMFTGLRWRGQLSGSVTARLQASYQRGSNQEKPAFCRTDPAHCEYIPARLDTLPGPYLSNNGLLIARSEGNDSEVLGEVEVRPRGRDWLQQRLRLSSRLRASSWTLEELIPGGVIYEHQGLQPWARTEMLDPEKGNFRSEGSTLRTIHAVEDEIRIADQLWVTPGLALITAHAGGKRLDTNQTGVAPRIGVAWNILADGLTWVRSSLGQRLAVDTELMARVASGTMGVRRCRWDPVERTYSRDCEASGGNESGLTFGSPCGPAALWTDATPCRSALTLPRTLEFTVGASRLLGAGASLDVDFIYRRTTGLAGAAETNRIWNPSGSDVVGHRTGRTETVIDWSTYPDLFRPYLGLTIAAQKRAGPLRFMLAYTWTDQGGPDHSLRALGTYDVLGLASLGLAYTFDSTPPLADAAPRADAHELNLQLRLHARRLTGVGLDIYGEMLHLAGSGSSTAVPQTTFASPSAGGTWWRFGAAYRY